MPKTVSSPGPKSHGFWGRRGFQEAQVCAMKALSYGDNLQVLRDSIATESVDLIYLDPPFNSKATYNVGLLGESGRNRMGGRTSACSQDQKIEALAKRSFTASAKTRLKTRVDPSRSRRRCPRINGL